MRLIKPKIISGEIMSLMEEAEEKMIFVAPYYNINKWQKLLNSLERLQKKKVDVEFYVREDAEKSINEVKNAGYQPKLIKRLHAKLYMNEKHAILTSMNLDYSSDNLSLDIAMMTETEDEYKNAFEYYERFIMREGVNQEVSQSSTFQQIYNWKDELDRRLEEALKKNVYIRNKRNSIEINANNRYEAFIANEKTNLLRINGILSYKEYQYLNNNATLFQTSKMKINLQQGTHGYYDLVWGTMDGFLSHSIHSLQNQEVELVMDSILKFIVGIEQMKKMVK